jgi:hypothetical protein
MVVLKVIDTHDAKELERRVHGALRHLRPSANREFFMVPYDLLVTIIEKLASSYDSDLEEANALIKTITDLRKSNNTINWTVGLDMSVFSDQMPNSPTTITVKSPKEQTILMLRDIPHDQAVELVTNIFKEYIKLEQKITVDDIADIKTPCMVDKDKFKDFAKNKVRSIYNLRKTDLTKIKFGNLMSATKKLPIKFKV